LAKKKPNCQGSKKNGFSNRFSDEADRVKNQKNRQGNGKGGIRGGGEKKVFGKQQLQAIIVRHQIQTKKKRVFQRKNRVTSFR